MRELPTKGAGPALNPVTTNGNASGTASTGATDGEPAGVGSRYSANIVQRVNKSLLADEPAGNGNANPGMIPVVGNGVRNTGRLLQPPRLPL